MGRKVGFVIAILFGLAAGLVYGWWINPATYSDTTLDSLRADYRTDYVLMVAETYQLDADPGMAARRLAYLGATAPVEIAIEALDYAQLHGFSEMDMRQMANLITALRLYTPVPQAPTPSATSGVEQTLVPLPSAGTLTP